VVGTVIPQVMLQPVVLAAKRVVVTLRKIAQKPAGQAVTAAAILRKIANEPKLQAALAARIHHGQCKPQQ
jgi:hypothetical protein